MITPMVQVEVLGRRDRLDSVLTALQRRRIAEVVPATGANAEGDGTALDGHAVAERIELVRAVLTGVPAGNAGDAAASADEEATVSVALSLLPELDALDTQIQALETEAAGLSHQVAVLGTLEGLVPELARLSDAELQTLSLATVALALDDPDGRVVALLEHQMTELLDGRVLLVSTATAAPGLSPSSQEVTGCLLVLPHTELARVQDLLGADRVTRVAVPQAYADRSLHATVTAMRQRLAELPREHDRMVAARTALLAPYVPALRATLNTLLARAERQEAAGQAVRTERTFALRLWVPASRQDELQETLTGESVVIARVTAGQLHGEPPVLLRTRAGWGPYQRLVSFLSWPSPTGVDPSGLMALALPFLFGVMVGDVAYGVVLMGLGWWLRRRPQPVLSDAGRIMLTGGAWATVFGVLFGEFLGNLGNSLGMPALWFYRGGPDALEPLLLFALALGAAHMVLGLLLGVWLAFRQRQLSKLADRGGTLLVLLGLFTLTGILAGLAPTGLLTPAIVAVVIGVVAACASHGALGLLLGPLELLGSLGNVLSYLRVAAVGLASVYLANVANELGAAAPLLLGILVATLLHVLNLALAAFSPTVQALRLHYVEFFSKFYDGGGRPFTPLGHALTPPAAQPATPAADPAGCPDAITLDRGLLVTATT